MSIGVHTALPPEQMVEPLRRVIAQLAPGSALHWVSSMRDELAGEYAAARFYLALVSSFGIAALLLAAVGLFALLSHAWLQRQAELGTRLALGADAPRLARLLLRDGLRLVGSGLAIGLLLAFPALSAIDGALYGVAAWDPFAWLGAALLLAAVAGAALIWPLRRALHLAPAAVLRG
jgi:ABC-type antimicrobial peptide transport system permease subunit